MKQKAQEWRLRLTEDIKVNKGGKMITLTFSNESIKEIIKIINNDKIKGYKLDNTIATIAIRRFLERYRKKNKVSMRHWLVTELGHRNTENIHLHGIIWTNSPKIEIEEYWKYGHIYIDYKYGWVNNQTINYITKYVNKIDEKHKYYNPIILTSPGIGNNYNKTYNSKQNKFNKENTIETYRTETGHKVAMPIYWRNKIYNDEEREQLWLIKLNKGERWICGDKIQAWDLKAQKNLLDWHRRKNRILGYGSNKINWDEKKQEEIQRQILIETRVQNSKK